MFDIVFNLNGEKQIIAMLTKQQCDAILAEGTFGVNALNLIEVIEHDA
jgi:hypothetical protein